MLIRDQKTLKEHLGGIEQDMSWNTMRPFVQQAERAFLSPAIGPELLYELNEAYDTALEDLGLSDNQAELLLLLQDALAYAAYLLASPFLILRAGDTGIVEIQGGNMVPARQWTKQGADRAAADSADLHLEQALAYLEAHADDFTTWKESKAYTEATGLLVPNARVFDTVIQIDESRRTYKALRNYIKQGEQRTLTPALGAAFLAEVKAAATTEMEEPMATVVELCRQLLCNRAMADAFPWLQVRILDGVVRMAPWKYGADSAQASTEQISSIQTQHASLADAILNDLKAFLIAHKEDFPTYAEYVGEEGQQAPTVAYDNSGKRHFRMP